MPGTSAQSLGTLLTDPIKPATSNAAAISGDGSVIVGTSTSGDSLEGFRGTAEKGMVGLGDLPGGLVGTSAEDVSFDGSVIVGAGRSELSQSSIEAFRWTSTGIDGLGFLNSSDHISTAEFVSADGRLVFGFSNDLAATQHYVWDARHGMRELVQVLESEHGLHNALAGWTDFVARGISDDGLSLVGSATNPDGNREAWLVQLDRPIGVPEPTAHAILILGFSALLFRQRSG